MELSRSLLNCHEIGCGERFVGETQKDHDPRAIIAPGGQVSSYSLLGARPVDQAPLRFERSLSLAAWLRIARSNELTRASSRLPMHRIAPKNRPSSGEGSFRGQVRHHSLAARCSRHLIRRGNQPDCRARRWMFLFGFAFGVVFAPTSLAQAKVVQLVYEAEAGLDCPTESEFRTDVERRLGSDPFGDGAATTVRVTFRGTRRGPTSQITWRNEDGPLPGVRDFEPRAQSCRALAMQVAFAVVVQIQLLPEYRVESSRESAGASSAVEVAAPKPPIAPTPEPVPTVEERPSPVSTPLVEEWTLGGGALGLLGWSPQIAVGVRVFAAARQRSFSVEGSAEWVAPSRVEQASGSGYELSTWSGALAPCFMLEQFSTCGVARIGRVNARGFGLDEARSPRGWLSQLGARLGFTQPVMGQLLLVAQGEVVGNFAPVRVELDRAEAWVAPPVAALFGLSVAASFR